MENGFQGKTPKVQHSKVTAELTVILNMHF